MIVKVPAIFSIFLLVSIFISYLLFFMILQLCHFRYYFFLYFWNKKQMV